MKNNKANDPKNPKAIAIILPTNDCTLVMPFADSADPGFPPNGLTKSVPEDAFSLSPELPSDEAPSTDSLHFKNCPPPPPVLCGNI